MRVLIIEDEKLAAERLVKLIKELEPSAEIISIIESVRASVLWLGEHNQPDLVFMDIQLGDGICFEIFEKINVEAPVIFTTAYNEYALKAFKVNSVDYLLKPIDREEISNAISKFKKIKRTDPSISHPQAEVFRKVMDMIRNPYKMRYVVRIGEHIKAIDTRDISFFFSSDKSTFIRTITNRDFGIDCSLDQIEAETDSRTFFRVSRKQIVAQEHITDIIAYSGNRLKLVLKGSEKDEIIVSREKVAEFKKWLEGK